MYHVRDILLAFSSVFFPSFNVSLLFRINCGFFFLLLLLLSFFFFFFFHFHSIEFEFYLLRKINGFVSVSVYPYNVFISMLLYISLCFVTIYRRLLLQSSFFCCFFCFQSQSLLILIRARIGNVIMR